MTDEAAVQRAVAEGVEHIGGYDVIVSNAGISGEIAPVEEYPTDVFRRVLDVHVLGAFLVAKHTLPHVRDGGSFVITSSVTGRVGIPNISGYCTAKHAQVGLMRVLAEGLAQDDIEVRSTERDSPRRRSGWPRRDRPARAPRDARRDRRRRALPRVRRQRHDHRDHVRHRRRDGVKMPEPSM